MLNILRFHAESKGFETIIYYRAVSTEQHVFTIIYLVKSFQNFKLDDVFWVGCCIVEHCKYCWIIHVIYYRVKLNV